MGFGRLFLCMLLVFSPFLATPAHAAVGESPQASVLGVHPPAHVNRSHDMNAHVAHDLAKLPAFPSGEVDCCDGSDICTHQQCSMNAMHAFALIKPVEQFFSGTMTLSWAHDTTAQRDGHRPLLDPPIP